jgi:hypothetical protein
MAIKNYDTKIATMAQDIEYIQKDINELKDTVNRIEKNLDGHYVRKDDLKFLYGVITTIAMAVVIYIVNYIMSILNK